MLTSSIFRESGGKEGKESRRYVCLRRHFLFVLIAWNRLDATCLAGCWQSICRCEKRCAEAAMGSQYHEARGRKQLHYLLGRFCIPSYLLQIGHACCSCIILCTRHHTHIGEKWISGVAPAFVSLRHIHPSATYIIKVLLVVFGCLIPLSPSHLHITIANHRYYV